MSSTDGWPVIHRYTRAQAIEDGVLVDVSEVAKEAGFVVPVAVTRAVFGLIEPTAAESAFGQDLQGRLWDVLWMARQAIRRSRPAALRHGREELVYSLIFQMRGRASASYTNGRQRLRLKIHSGPGDEGEQVITIMLPQED